MKRPEYVTARHPRSGPRYGLPPGIIEVARSRTSFAIPLAEHHALPYLLASAWLQGVEDATMAMASRPAGAAFLDGLAAAKPPPPADPLDDVWPL